MIRRPPRSTQPTTLFPYTTLFRSLVEQAKREAGVSKQIVDDMNKMAGTLKAVEEQTQQYLGKVNEVLTTSFNSFGGSVKTSLETSTGAFQSELDKGVKILKAAFDELSVVVSQFPRRP
jgi:methionine salvage enolase-phosphatase E1